MRNAINIKKILLCAFALLLAHGNAFAASWSGNIDSGSNVLNQDLSIDGTVTIGTSGLPADQWVSISATVVGNTPHSVNVSLNNGNREIRAANGVPARLYLQADQDCYIKFAIDHRLRLFGSDDGQPLLIIVRGRGTVIFEMDNDSNVVLGQAGGPTNIFVLMESQCCDHLPTLLFRYAPGSTSQASNVIVNADSRMGFISGESIVATPDLHDAGIIRFDAAQDAGTNYRMTLNILDKGSVVVAGRYVNLPVNPDDLVLGDIDFTQPAGCEAVFSVVNSLGADEFGGLVIENKNTELSDYLADPWTNLGARNDGTNYKGSFSGIQYGMVIGANGQLSICEDAYVEYAGLALDKCPTPVIPCDSSVTYNLCCGNDLNCCCTETEVPLCEVAVEKLVKKRNPSALVVDGYLAPEATPAIIKMADRSALFFLSGVDNDGVYNDAPGNDQFTIDPAKQTPCLGNLVFDVEGELSVIGSGNDRALNPTKIELLSLHVDGNGGPVLINGTETNFPIRDFDKDGNGDYLQYNKGYFLFNNCVQMCDTWLVHSDVLHMVYEKDDVNSQPAYIGGETFKLVEDFPHPTVAFTNTTLMVHSDLASTGFDWLIPNALDCSEPTCTVNCDPGDTCIEVNQGEIIPVYDPALPCLREGEEPEELDEDCEECDCGCDEEEACDVVRTRALCDGGCPFEPAGTCIDNQSSFIFFYNGYAVDSGTGRQMILGTYIGSTACDCCSIISKDSHLDVMQHTDVNCSPLTIPLHSLYLYTEANNDTIVEQIVGDVTGQYSIQTIYLGQASNISIGTHLASTGCTLVTNPELVISGNFYSFETRGGLQNSPETSNVTGQGGIFVDTNGKISIDSLYRANVSTMVTKSDNGVIELPRTNTFFDLRVGAAQWKLDLSDPTQRTIVEADNTISDYTLNWINTTKDYLTFIPYINGVYGTCMPVVTANVSSLPTVYGTIEQLQIAESRLGDPAHVMIDGGFVRELVFLNGYNSAEAPVGVVALQNCGRVGLGSAHTNVDSLQASVKLGVNGVTIIANGDGRVTLNSDLVIDNMCHIMKGPDFNKDILEEEVKPQVLVFDAECPRELRVKGTGTLDLSSFTRYAQDLFDTIEFTENVRIVLEPGAQVILNGAKLKLSGSAEIICEPAETCDIPIPSPAVITSYDDIRVKLIGGEYTSELSRLPSTIELSGCSRFIINENAFVGVETLGDTITTANLNISINDSASFLIGDGCSPYGGALQVGDTTENAGNTISFSLSFNGNDALFQINSRGFFGTGVGIVDKQPGDAPNKWSVGALYNVENVSINIQNGAFVHNRIFDGDSVEASLFMVGPSIISGNETHYTFGFETTESRSVNLSESVIRGGGNFALLKTLGPVNPVVLSIDGSTGDDLSVGLFASTPFFNSNSLPGDTAADVYDFCKIFDVTLENSHRNGRAAVGKGIRKNEIKIGYVDGTVPQTLNKYINRCPWVAVIGDGGTVTTQNQSLYIGCVAVRFPTNTGATYPRNPISVLELS